MFTLLGAGFSVFDQFFGVLINLWLEIEHVDLSGSCGLWRKKFSCSVWAD